MCSGTMRLVWQVWRFHIGEPCFQVSTVRELGLASIKGNVGRKLRIGTATSHPALCSWFLINQIHPFIHLSSSIQSYKIGVILVIWM